MPKDCNNDFTYVGSSFVGISHGAMLLIALRIVLLLDDILIFELGFRIVERGFLPQYKLRQEALASGVISL